VSSQSDRQITKHPESPRGEPSFPGDRSWPNRNFPDGLLRLCALLTVGLICMPPEGLPGIELCLFKRLTNIPCPGCGLTRCGSNLVRGNVVRATEFNPFGLAIIPVMVGMGVLGVLPRRWRERARRVMAPYGVACQRLLLVFTIAFVLFGLIRGFGVWRGWLEFPAQWS
jgi:hypothetical protein